MSFSKYKEEEIKGLNSNRNCRMKMAVCKIQTTFVAHNPTQGEGVTCRCSVGEWSLAIKKGKKTKSNFGKNLGSTSPTIVAM